MSGPHHGGPGGAGSSGSPSPACGPGPTPPQSGGVNLTQVSATPVSVPATPGLAGIINAGSTSSPSLIPPASLASLGG